MPITAALCASAKRRGQRVAEGVPGKAGQHVAAQPFGRVSATPKARMRMAPRVHSRRANADAEAQ